MILLYAPNRSTLWVKVMQDLGDREGLKTKEKDGEVVDSRRVPGHSSQRAAD